MKYNNSEDNNNENQEEPMTEDERKFAEQLDQKIQNAQQKLDQLGLTQSRLNWLQNTIKKRQEENPLTEEENKEKFQQLADRQGRKNFTLEETLTNYNNAWGLLKYRDLPIYWSNLKDKIIFTLSMPFMAAYNYETMQLKKSIQVEVGVYSIFLEQNFVYQILYTLMIFGNILYEFSDIKSYHYETKDRKKLARELRSQLLNKPNKKDQN